MCIIIHAKPGQRLSKENLKVAFFNNPDGVGFLSFGQDGGDEVYYHDKWLPNDACEVDKLMDDHIDNDLVVHLRWRTTGDIDLDSCHPFEVFSEEELQSNPSLYKVWAMHNGTFSFTPTGEMDTSFVVSNIIKPILLNDINALHDVWFSDMLEKLLGYSGRMTFVTAFGDIIHIGKFDKKDGCEVSNLYSFNPNHRNPVQSSKSTKDTSTKHIGNNVTTFQTSQEKKEDAIVRELDCCFDVDRVKELWNQLPDAERLKVGLRRPDLLVDLLDMVCMDLDDDVGGVFPQGQTTTAEASGATV